MRQPDDMTPSQRMEEIAAILAQGILRRIMLEARKSNRFGEIPLDSSGKESVHAENK